MSFIESHPLETVLRAMSLRICKRCVSFVEGCLLPDEVEEVEREFYEVIRADLEELVGGLARKREETGTLAGRN